MSQSRELVIKTLKGINGAVRDLMITGPKNSVHIDTTNSTLCKDAVEAIILNHESIGLNLNKAMEVKVEQLDNYFYELIINNKEVTSVLKQGEINAILNNIKKDENGDVRIGNNSIFLNKTKDVLLRTNGLVVYGEYIVSDTKRIEFTFNPDRHPLPYIGNGIIVGETRSYFKVNYADYKETVLYAFRQSWTKEAKAKFEEMRSILSKAVNETKTINKKENKEMPQEPIMQETKKEEKKVEVQEMNIMTLAHKIRIGLSLEGHYHAQMKVALSYAWQVKKGQVTLEELLNITETSAPVAADTYNATNTKTDEAAVTTDDVKEEKTVVATDLTIFLKSFNNGIAEFHKIMNGVESKFMLLKARNLRDVDKQFAAKLPDLINMVPQGTVIHSYGDYTYLTYLNDLKAVADSKGIIMKSSTVPSGIAV